MDVLKYILSRNIKVRYRVIAINIITVNFTIHIVTTLIDPVLPGIYVSYKNSNNCFHISIRF